MSKLTVQQGAGMLRVTNGKFVEANDTLCAMLGFEPQQLVGMLWRHFIHPTDWTSMEAFVRDALEADGDIRAQARRFVAEGDLEWGYARAWRVEDDMIAFEFEPLASVTAALAAMQADIDSLQHEAYEARERRRAGYAILDESRNTIEDELFSLRRFVKRMEAGMEGMAAVATLVAEHATEPDVRRLAIAFEGMALTFQGAAANLD